MAGCQALVSTQLEIKRRHPFQRDSWNLRDDTATLTGKFSKKQRRLFQNRSSLLVTLSNCTDAFSPKRRGHSSAIYILCMSRHVRAYVIARGRIDRGIENERSKVHSPKREGKLLLSVRLNGNVHRLRRSFCHKIKSCRYFSCNICNMLFF